MRRIVLLVALVVFVGALAGGCSPSTEPNVKATGSVIKDRLEKEVGSKEKKAGGLAKPD